LIFSPELAKAKAGKLFYVYSNYCALAIEAIIAPHVIRVVLMFVISDAFNACINNHRVAKKYRVITTGIQFDYV
jgi:hypothetical protein